MRNRFDPWPAVADLFSSLMVASFAGLIIFTAVHEGQVARIGGCRETVHQEATGLIDRVRDALKTTLQPDQVHPCGSDVCIEVPVRFGLNEDVVDEGERPKLQAACGALKQALERAEQRKEIEIFIDGHADKQQARRVEEPTARYRHNWNLSAKRATAVLYEFNACGVTVPDYRILAIGHADTQPLCLEDSEPCFAKNRRTTFRLRPDTQAIERRIGCESPASFLDPHGLDREDQQLMLDRSAGGSGVGPSRTIFRRRLGSDPDSVRTAGRRTSCRIKYAYYPPSPRFVR